MKEVNLVISPTNTVNEGVITSKCVDLIQNGKIDKLSTQTTIPQSCEGKELPILLVNDIPVASGIIEVHEYIGSLNV